MLQSKRYRGCIGLIFRDGLYNANRLMPVGAATNE